MSKYTYSINESAEDFRDSILTKSGVSVNFTLREVDADAKRIRKALKELKATKQLHEAKMKYIENNYPSILDVKEEERKAIRSYQDAHETVLVSTQKIDEIEVALAGYEEELKDINTQLGVTINLNEDAKEEKK